MKFLVVEDDVRIAFLLKKGLEKEGHIVDVAHTAKTGYQFIIDGFYNALILDIRLPDMDGISFCRQLRLEQIDIPILMLTARDSVQDKITGLTEGADDYMTKPFSFEELLARLHALMRRPSQYQEDDVLTVGELTMRPMQNEVFYQGESISLSRKEFSVLELLMRNANQVLTRETILDRVWQTGFEPEANVVDAVIARLRMKMTQDGKDSMIKTVRGIGYKIQT